MVGAVDARAVQVGGPSGECVSARRDAQRRIAFEDLPCNGAFTIFDSTRDLLGIVRHHLQFFVDGVLRDLRALPGGQHRAGPGTSTGSSPDGPSPQTSTGSWSGASWSGAASRCGLGGTSPKPRAHHLGRFPEI